MQNVKLPLLLLMVAAGALLAACAPQPAARTPEPAASSTHPAPTAAAQPSPTQARTPAPTSAPTKPNTPTGLSGKISTYRDDAAGMELDYPEGWNVIDVRPDIKKQSQAYTVTFMSWKPAPGGGQGIPKGETKIDLTVIKTGGAVPEIAAARKQELAEAAQPPRILLEETWTLANGAQAVRWRLDSPALGQSAELITALNGRTILLDGSGDLRLFDQIARTLRPAAGTAVKGTLPTDAVWVFVNGRVVAVAPGAPAVDLREPGQQAFSGPGQSTVTADGSELLYFRFTTNPQNQQLLILDTRTGKTRVLAESATLWSPRLSPDGRSVAYTVINSQNYENAKWELIVRDLAGSAQRVVLSGERKTAQDMIAPLVPVHWSATGLLVEKIIWASDAPPQGLYRVDLTNGSLTPVYPKSYVRAVVSPDGTRAVLVQGQIQMGESQPRLELNLLDLASGQVRPIVPETAIWLTSLRWSPDSSKILFTIQPALAGSPGDSPTSPGAELHVMNADGTNAQQLALQVQYALRDVTWQDNGTLLFLFADPQNTLHVSRAPLGKLQLQSLVEVGRVGGSDPQNPGDQFIYIPR